MKLLYPLRGIGQVPGIYITQGFGQHPEIYAQFGLEGHDGLDIAAPLDTPILAPHDGKVEYGFDPKGYGNFVRLFFDQDGFTWDCIFGHLHTFEGRERGVGLGDILGYVDSTGFSTGNHLHFGVRKLLNGQVVDYNNGYFGYIDPLPFLKEFMSNVKLVQNGGEYAFYLPATNEATLIDKALNFDYPIPRKADGTVDWNNLKPDFTIN